MEWCARLTGTVQRVRVPRCEGLTIHASPRAVRLHSRYACGGLHPGPPRVPCRPGGTWRVGLFVVVVPPLGSALSDQAIRYPPPAWLMGVGTDCTTEPQGSGGRTDFHAAGHLGFSAADREVPCSSLSLAAISRMRSPGVVRYAMKTLAIPGTDDVAFRHGGSATDAGAAYAGACQRWGNSSWTRFARCVGMRASTSLSQSWGLTSCCLHVPSSE